MRRRFIIIPAGLQALLVALKLAGLVRWPWWLIFAPAVIVAAGWVAFMALVLLALGQWGKPRGGS